MALLVAVTICAGGCQSELYTDLPEDEANQMLAILMSHGIDTNKVAKGKEGFTINVEDHDLLRAIAVLKDNGFPRSSPDSIGKVFQKSGIISSPFEERVRYIYALGEEVGQTLSNIDGVVTARVHIVIPDAPQLGQPVKPSQAAVFIKKRPDVDLDFFVPQIKRLVSSSIEGLEYSAVTVVLADAAPLKVAKSETATVEVLPGIAVLETDTGQFWRVFIGGSLFAGILLIGNLFALYNLLRKRVKKSPEAAGVPMVEPS